MVQPFGLRDRCRRAGNFARSRRLGGGLRYTEPDAAIAAELLAVRQDRSDYHPTSTTAKEPTSPARIPNLLVNGASGIAVGMATNIPPHNLREVVGGLIALIDNPEIELPELRRHIKGPDFPTGGYIYGTQGIQEAYETGRGKVIMRARASTEIKTTPRADHLTEIPTRQTRASEQIASRAGQEVTDISDRETIRPASACRDGQDDRSERGCRPQPSYSHTPPGDLRDHNLSWSTTSRLIWLRRFSSASCHGTSRGPAFEVRSDQAESAAIVTALIAGDTIDEACVLLQSGDPSCASRLIESSLWSDRRRRYRMLLARSRVSRRISWRRSTRIC